MATESGSSRPLRLAYVWDRLLPTTGTDAEQALSTVAALARAGAQVRLVLPRARSRPTHTAAQLRDLYQLIGDFEVDHIDVPCAENMPLRKAAYAWAAPRHTWLKDVDVVHTRNCATFLGLMRSGHPTLYDTHRAWPDRVPMLRPWLRWALQQPSCVGVACHSRFTRESYLRMGADPERVLEARNGHDPRRFHDMPGQLQARRQLGLPQDAIVATYAGHMSRFKGMGSILRLAECCKEVAFLLVGGEAPGWTERNASKLPNVRIVPWQPYGQAIPYLSAADILLLPTTAMPLQLAGHTVLPMKVYGYLMAGRAILGPATPDLLEVLVDGHNARLVPPDDPPAATRALRELVASPALRARLGAGAREAGRELTWDARAAKLQAFIRSRLETMGR